VDSSSVIWPKRLLKYQWCYWASCSLPFRNR